MIQICGSKFMMLFEPNLRFIFLKKNQWSNWESINPSLAVHGIFFPSEGDENSREGRLERH